jgi:hypothetical protein
VIPVANDQHRFDATGYQQALRQIVVWAEERGSKRRPMGILHPSSSHEPRVEYVTRQSLYVPFDKPWLADEADVEAYVAAFRQTLLAIIQSGKRVQI